MTQEIIIYRSPLEQQMWNSLMSPDGGLIFAAVIIAAIVWASVYLIAERFTRYFRFTRHARTVERFEQSILYVPSLLAAFATFYMIAF